MNASDSRKDKRVGPGLFLVLLFTVCWVGTAPMVLASWGKIHAAALYQALQVVCMLLGPAIVAVTASALNGGKAEVKQLLRRLLIWRVGWFPWLFVLIVPAVLCAAALWLSGLITHTAPHFRSPATVLPVFAAAFIPYLLLNTEELAWRGYLLPRLQSTMGALSASFVIGVFWALFHVPIFLMKGGHPAGHNFFAFFVLVVAMSFTFTVIFNRAAGSVLVVHILHQSLNSWPEAFPYFAKVTGNHVAEYVFVALVALVSFVLVLTVGRRAGAQLQLAQPAQASS